MAAWILAWIDRREWQDSAAADTDSMGAIGAALRAGSNLERVEVSGFGLLQSDGMPVPYLESLPPRLVTWDDGHLDIYVPNSETDIDAFLEQDSAGLTGPVLMFMVDADQLGRHSDREVGEAVRLLLAGEKTATLGHAFSGVRASCEVPWDATVFLAWCRGDLNRTEDLPPSDRHELIGWLGGSHPIRLESDRGFRLVTLSLATSDKTPLELPVDSGSLMVLLGRNGAGKTWILENIALALSRVRGIEVGDLRSSLPSLVRRSDKDLKPDARARLQVSRQEDAPEFFRRLFFISAYSPISRQEMVKVMPSGRKVWDALTPIASPDALDPRHLLETFDLPGIRAALIDGMLKLVRAEYDSSALRRIFDSYLSGTDIILDSDGSITYRPPDGSMLVGLLHDISFEQYLRLVSSDANGSARDAICWAFAQALRELIAHPADGGVEALVRNLDPEGPFKRFSGLTLEALIAELDGLQGRVDLSVVGLGMFHPQAAAIFEGWQRSPWTELYNELLQRARDWLPLAVPFDPDPGPDDLETMVEGLLIGLARTVLRPSTLDKAAPSHPFAWPDVGPAVEVMADLLAERATGLLPGFAAANGPILIRVAPREEWHRRRVHVTLGPDDSSIPLASAAGGVLAWCTACLRFAAAQLRASRWAENDDARTIALTAPEELAPSIDGSYPFLYLVDEPEAHLHPTARKEVVDVCDKLAQQSSGGVLVATHALEFVGTQEMVSATYLVEGGIAQKLPPGLPALRERSQQLGVSPGAVLMSARAVLCVEGPTDEWAVSTFAGDALNRSLVYILRLFGMERLADRLPDLDLVFSLDIPVYLLLDHVRRSKLRELLERRSVGVHTKEEQELSRLAQTLRGDRKATVLPMSKVDILRTVPDEAMARAFEHSSWGTWPKWSFVDAAMEDRHRHGRPASFKDDFRGATGVEVHRVVDTLRRLKLSGLRSPDLDRVANTLLADLSSGRYRNGERLRYL